MATRRRRGEGSVYQRSKDGKWVGTADFGWRDGKRIRRTVIRDTERQATTELRKLIRMADAGVVPERMTVARWLEHWLGIVGADPKRKPRTVVGYRQYVDRYIVPAIGRHELSKLTPDHVRQLHESMRGKGLSETTVRQAHVILQRALRVAQAERDGLLARNVAQIVGAPGAAKNPHEILTADQSRAVLQAADGARERARFACALLLGLRQGEALGLEWRDVVLLGTTGTVTVRQTVQQVAGRGLVLGEPKSKSSKRTIPLIPAAAQMLADWREESGGVGFVFHGHAGAESPEGPRRDYAAWKVALERAGVPHVSLHGARGSVATLLQSVGTPYKMIASILGHADTKVTAEHYLHSDAAAELEALTRVGAALGLE